MESKKYKKNPKNEKIDFFILYSYFILKKNGYWETIYVCHIGLYGG